MIEVGSQVISARRTTADQEGRLGSWLMRGGYAVADQAAFSGANFLLNIFLARSLSPTDYGAFALAVSIFLFLSGFQNALLLEPMSVIGPAAYADRLRLYLGSLLRVQAGLTILLVGLLLTIAGGVAASPARGSLPQALLGLSLSLPTVHLFWLLRRAFYLQQDARSAAGASVLYSLLLLAGLAWLQRRETVSLLAATSLMGLASLPVSAVLAVRLKVPWRGTFRSSSVENVVRANWHYGRWIAAAAVVYWLSGDVYYLLTTALLGLEQTGALRALLNLILPLNHTMTALGMLLLPWSSRRVSTRGVRPFRRDAARIAWIMTGLACGYVFLLALLGQPIVRLLYGPKYTAWTWLLPYLTAVPFLAAIGTGWQIGLRVVRAPQTIFAAYCASAAITLTVGPLLISHWGLAGVPAGLLLGGGCQLLVLWAGWRKATHADRGLQADSP